MTRAAHPQFTFADLEFEDAEGTDFHAVSQGLISVTPIHLDLTNYKSFEALRALQLPWP